MGHQVAEVDGNGNPIREEVYAGGKHLATYANGTTYFDHGDQVGTERVRTTATGTKCESIVSLPFGDGQSTSGSCGDPSPMHMMGKERDPESNLDDFGARFYSSTFGRWMSPDWSDVPEPTPYANLSNPQTLNIYALVRDNPETFADLDGHNYSLLQAEQGGAGDAPLFGDVYNDTNPMTSAAGGGAQPAVQGVQNQNQQGAARSQNPTQQQPADQSLTNVVVARQNSIR